MKKILNKKFLFGFLFVFTIGVILISTNAFKTNAAVGTLDVSVRALVNPVSYGGGTTIEWSSSPLADWCDTPVGREGASGSFSTSEVYPDGLKSDTTFSVECYKADPLPPLQCYSYNLDPDTCFIADTKVILADGSTKNIQDVQIGDVLKGEKTNNTVLGFHRPELNGKLYSFNGGRYFVTEEHPFKTTNGWKSINPKKTANDNIGIKVTELKVGDTLITEKGKVLLKTIDSKEGKANTELYNFKLDGDHTYYADGYLVHNKGYCDTGSRYGDCPNGQTCFYPNVGATSGVCRVCPQSCMTGFTGECSGGGVTICKEDATCK